MRALLFPVLLATLAGCTVFGDLTDYEIASADSSVSADGAVDSEVVDGYTPPTGCTRDEDCFGALGGANPPNCAAAICDKGIGACKYKAKDSDGDKHAAAVCAVGSFAVELGDDCDDNNAAVYPGAWDGPTDGDHAASCDGVDNDCSKAPDDGKDSTGKTCECTTGATGECSELEDGTPITFPGGIPKGLCKKGTHTCGSNGKWGVCKGAVAPATKDTCVTAGSDDNCNGTPNEGCPCISGSTQKCGTCTDGTQTCTTAGVWGPCIGARTDVGTACDSGCGTIKCDGTCTTSGHGGACDAGCGKIKCDGTCSTSGHGGSCDAGCGTVKCDGTCTTSGHGGSCDGGCGTVKCDGTCTTSGHGGACDSGCGKILCTGACSTSGHGGPCDNGCGTITCSGACSTSGHGGSCDSGCGFIRCDGTCSTSGHGGSCDAGCGKITCSGACSTSGHGGSCDAGCGTITCSGACSTSGHGGACNICGTGYVLCSGSCSSTCDVNTSGSSKAVGWGFCAPQKIGDTAAVYCPAGSPVYCSAGWDAGFNGACTDQGDGTCHIYNGSGEADANWTGDGGCYVHIRAFNCDAGTFHPVITCRG